ncbi:MAG: cell division protein FtsH, partial [Microbacterium sp.]|nr:cell division protein FtsH [Microbacterium sp.]
ALIEQAHNEAYQVISDNRDILDRLALALLEEETLDHNQIAEIFTDVRKLPERPLWLSSDERPVSALPPIDVPKRSEVGIAAQTTAPAETTRQKPQAGHTRPATA